MADTGYRSPGTVVNDASYGVVAWISPDAAKISDNLYTRVPGLRDGAISQYLKSTNFGFTIPDGSIIDGILVEIERMPNTAGLVGETRVRIVRWDGVIGTTDKSKGDWPVTETYYVYGGATDLWGETWTSARINDVDFGVVLAIVDDVGGVAYVDHVRIKVYYTLPGTNIKINVGDLWKTVTQIQINIGDSWKTVTQIQINIGDSWKTLFG